MLKIEKNKLKCVGENTEESIEIHFLSFVADLVNST